MLDVAGVSEQFISAAAFAWAPVLIWTVVAIFVLFALRYAEKMHAQFQYHIRLGLFLALPAGLMMSGMIEFAEWLQRESESSLSAYKLLVIQSPLEITLSANSAAGSSFLNFANITLLFGVFYSAGFLFLLSGYLFERFRLCKLTSSVALKSIHTFESVSVKNRKLAALSTEPVRLGIVDAPLIPFTFGHRRPVIILPKSIFRDNKKLNIVLRHELMHIRHRDYLVHHFLIFTRTLFWIHPLIHLLFRQILDYREMRIDSHVLSDSSISKKSYASVLLELIPFNNFEQSAAAPSAVGMARETSNLKKRVDMMKNQTKRYIPSKLSLTSFSAVLISLVLFMACTDLQQHNILDDEDLNMMADYDVEGTRGHHEITLFMGDPEATDSNLEKMEQLRQIHPEDIESINVYKGESAVKKFGDRAEHGAITVRLKSNSPGMEKTFDTFGLKMPDTSAINNSVSPQEDDYFVVVEEMPELIGGLAELQKKISYPEEAREAGIEGRVYVQFIVNENGDVENPRVIRGIGGGADEEALNAVKQAKFKPGYQRGEPVRVQFSLPFVFQLNREE